MHNLEIEKLVMQKLMQFPLFDKTRTARPNINFTPPISGIWIRPTILVSDNQIVGMSDKPCIRERGFIYIQVFDRVNTGTGNLKSYTDQLSNFFKTISIDRLELLAPKVDDVGVNTSEQMYQMNVIIPYRYN